MSSLPIEARRRAAYWKEKMGEAAAAFSLGAAWWPDPVGPICSALFVGCGLSAKLAQQYENDPPDLDATTRVRPFHRPLDREALGKLEVDRRLIDLALALNDSEALASAALRAYERALAGSGAGALDDRWSRVSQS